MQIKKVCEYCKQIFIAQKTTTKYCSHPCNQKGYKQRMREQKMSVVQQQTIQKVEVSSSELANVQNKAFLDIKEACLLLKCSESTLRKLIKCGEVPTLHISRKHIIRREDIDGMF